MTGPVHSINQHFRSSTIICRLVA